MEAGFSPDMQEEVLAERIEAMQQTLALAARLAILLSKGES